MASALPPLATVTDLSDWIGEPIESESADAKRALSVLRLASSLIRSKKVTNRTWVDPDTNQLVEDMPDIVAEICIQAAARKYTNPDDLEQERQDDFYASRKVKEAGVYLTDSELAMLAEYTATPHGGLGTVRTTRGDYPTIYDGDLTGDPILPPYYL